MTPTRTICLIVIALTMLNLGSMKVCAHDARPVYVEISERSGGRYLVRWKVPVSVPIPAQPRVELPEQCEARGDSLLSQQGDAYFHQQTYTCTSGLSGQELALRYPTINPSLSTLFRISLLNGERYTQVMRPGQESWKIPDAENFWRVAGQYTVLGIEHILRGVDHLLFVACLVFIARTLKRIVITATGFTLAHSLTLILSTLGVVRLPVAPVETAIALSIVFLAHEIALGRRASSWTWRRPVTVSASFGLLHGCGFASVLLNVGLPQTELMPALLFFNLGVEIGQIVFILALTVVAQNVARGLKTTVSGLLDHRRVMIVGSYLIGSVSSFWMVQRITGF